MNNTTLPKVFKNHFPNLIVLIVVMVTFQYGFSANETKPVPFSNKPFAPGISITVDGNPLDALEGNPGCNLVLYEITVTNTGDENLDNIVITDDLLEPILTGPTESLSEDGILEVGEVWTYSAAYVTTPQEKINDQVETMTSVSANVVGQPDQIVNDNDATIIPLPSCPLSDEIAVIKVGVPLEELEAGPGCNLVLYQFSVTSEGGNNLENVVLNDPLLGGDIIGPDGGDDNNNNVLEPGETWVYTVPYVTTIQDKFDEEVINQAIVTANIEGDPNSIVIDLSDDNSVLENDPTVVGLPSCPSKTNIAVIKAGAALEDIEAGPGCNLILYEFTVTNEGAEVLENIVLNDPLLGGDIAGPSEGDDNNNGFLDLNEIWRYTAVYNITQEDLMNGFFENQATVSADIQGLNQMAIDLSDDNSVEEDDPTIIDLSFCDVPDIGLIKTGTVVDIDGDGCVESILYTFTLTNTGNVDIDEITLEDDLLGGEVPGPVDGTDANDDGILSVGETWTYEAIYAITQEDIDNANVINQATVNGEIVDTEIVVSDLSHDANLDEDGPTRTPVPDDACTEGSADIGLIKTGAVVDIDGDGCVESILYTFTLTNTGGADIDEITVEDELLGGEVPGPVDGTDDNDDGILSVGETWTYEAIYAITQEDIDNASVINQATVNGEIVNTEIAVSDLSHDANLDEDGPTRTPVPDDACTEGSAEIGLIKIGAVVDIDGDGCVESILYTFTLTNTGGADIDEITLEDELLGGEVPGPIDGTDANDDGILSVGETWTYEAIYAITQQDIDNAAVVNQAEINGEIVDTEITVSDLSHDEFLDQDGPTRTPVPNDACTEGSASMGLIKVGELIDINNDGCVDTIRYTFTLTNMGSAEINEISLEDELFLGEIPGPQSESIDENGVLQVGETWVYLALYGLTQEDIDNGSVINQADVNGEIVDTEISVSDLSHDVSLDEDGPTETSVPNDACPGGGDGNPLFAIAIIKTGEGIDADFDGCDDSIEYTFTVINSGLTDLENIVLTDDLLGGQVNGLVATDETDDGILQPGEEWIYTATYNLTQEDIDGIFVDNQAVVTADLINSTDSVFDNSDDNSYQENDITSINVSTFCEFTGGGSGFEIFNGITPNGDGLNDFFRIQGIENYPDNNVKIFNRWGVQVYEINSYGQGNNLFYGISEGRATLQQERELPSGTYFYILTFTSDENPGEESYSGYLYINRD